MKSSFRSVRAALVVVSAVGVGAVMNGCSAGADGGEQTGEANQATTIRPVPIQSIHNLASETGPADPYAGDTCVSFSVAPPPSLLAQYDCTLGDLYGSPSADPITGVWSYAFACEAGITGVLPKSLGLPIPPEVTAIPSLEPIDESVTWSTLAQNSCFGNSDAGWVIVVDSFYHLPISGNCIGSNCDDGQPNPPIKGRPIQ
jgi:hypothetical protein